MRKEFMDSLRAEDLDYGNGLSTWQASCLTEKRSEIQLLRLLSFWQGKARVHRDGRVWMIKTASELYNEGFIYSERTIKRTIKSLKEQDLIIVEHHPHPFVHGILRASWICLSDDTLKFIRYCKREAVKEGEEKAKHKAELLKQQVEDNKYKQYGYY